MALLTLNLVGPDGEWSQYLAEIDPELKGRWVELRATASKPEDLRVRIGAPSDDPHGHTVYYSFRARSKVNLTVLYLQPDATEISVERLGLLNPPLTLEVSVTGLSKFAALFRLMSIADQALIRSALAGRPSGLPNRLRDTLANALKWTYEGFSHSRWVRAFDGWGPGRVRALRERLAHAPDLRVAAVLFSHHPNSNATKASLEALNALGIDEVELFNAAGNLSLAIPTGTDYVAIVQAGELLSPHAIVALRYFHDRQPNARAFYADEDVLYPEGYRADPFFKPEPGRFLMASGALSRGVWFVKPDELARFDLEGAKWAEALRMRIWFRLYEAGLASETWRIPSILTHRRWDAEVAPPEYLGAVVREHFDRSNLTVEIDVHRFPLDVRIVPTRFEKVAVVIPTGARKPHVERCLEAVLSNTSYEPVEFVIVVSQIGDLDQEQNGILAKARQDARVKILLNSNEPFNFSQANNFAVANSESSYVCLLNDDIIPLSSDWLEVMVGSMMDPHVGVVGAKLLFEDRTVQHGGVILGIDGFSAHAFVGLSGDEPGYAGRAVVDQELSAVTGACLLTRRAVYESVGGLDESFPSAHNDLDYCLKVGERGFRTVWSAHARLIHLESLSFGTHYAIEDSDQEELDRNRFRDKWLSCVIDDPFHNPNLAKIWRREWTYRLPAPDIFSERSTT